MAFKTMDPALVRKLIEQHEDIITPAAKADAELYEHARCPACGHTGADKVILPPKVDVNERGEPKVVSSSFSPGSPVVKGHARCRGCEIEYSPISGLIYKATQPILTDVQR